MIPLLLAMIKVKKHIDLLPSHTKKEDFVHKKLNEFIKWPIEIQSEELISEQERILFSLKLNIKFIIYLVKLEFEKTTSLESKK